MPGPTTEALDAHLKSVAEELKLVGLMARKTETEFNIAKWFFGLTLTMILGGIFGCVWTVSALTSDVKALDARVTKVETKLEKIEERLGRIESHIAGVDATLKQILERLPAPSKS